MFATLERTSQRRLPLASCAAALTALLALLTRSTHAAEPVPSQVTYVDVTKEAGIDFQHTFGDDHMSWLLEATGSGCAWLDYDNDGWLDLYLANGCYLEKWNDEDSDYKNVVSTDKLYHNKGNGTFEDVTEKAGVGDPRYGMAVVCGDYDSDGDADIFVTNYGRNTLYRNNGNGTFTDVTEKAGLARETEETEVGPKPLWGLGAVFFDYDNDGDLDLFTGNYVRFDEYRQYYAADEFPGPLSYPAQQSFLYRNNGDGTFSDVTKEAGMEKKGRAMGVIAADYDDDGDVDLYVANDAMANYLYRNNGDGTFTDLGLASGTAFSANGDSSASMGGEFADYDNDGDLDLLVPDIKFNNLYKNLGGGLFDDVTAAVGIAEISGQYQSWAGFFLDYDNDGDRDIFISNGSDHRLDTQENLLLENVPGPDGARVFRDAGPKCGKYWLTKDVARGACVGDYDNDGDLDIFILAIDQPSHLIRNDGGNKNNWLQVKLRGTRSNRDAVGARVKVRAGDLVLIDEKKNAASYLSQNDPRLHFGLAQRNKVDEVTVRWPRGTVQTLKDVPVNKVLELVEPLEGKAGAEKTAQDEAVGGKVAGGRNAAGQTPEEKSHAAQASSVR